MNSSKKSPLAFKRALILTLILIFVSPIFGVILADMVGYHEPLDVAAEALDLSDITESLNWTPFLDYTVPGLPADVGYIIAGFIGIGIMLSIGFILNKIVKKH
ncbi:TPA: cobalamin biosynthesis protein [Candidatus Bathyarchaeota archaeon]|nr:cobalamin biosynthesis protein [Candidatus Bathyarchaeota archaeon]